MDISIPREAVDKAARSLFNHEYTGQFDTLAPVDQHILREKAVGALDAAASLIVAAAFEQFVKTIDTITDPASDAWMRAEKCGMRDVTRQLQQQAEQLRGGA
jgi:hypothetical protein